MAIVVADTDADGAGLVIVGVPGATVIGPNRALRNVGRLLVVALDASRTPVGEAVPVTQRRPAAGADERGDRFGSVLSG